MLQPIDTDRIIRDSRVSGSYPEEIHQGVAWWVAACFVVVSGAGQMAVAHDDHPVTDGFHRRFCLGAINAGHWRCQVCTLGVADEAQLLYAMQELGCVPGALLTTAESGTRPTVTIRLYDTQGRPVAEDTGLAMVREMIARDRVPLPVNEQAKGRITSRRDLLEGL
ncbi:hypothetical protein [Streptomyces rubradiris]|uniref:Uncharacterized protein n=1 Tax=Streptomyces rubradiris TaxID=285531 RepID=A0ABQ3RP54_STRRR|nr:hypothetical protein [Streptomyces rubradiris]GHH12567.1 hypothetical protein GCM10018792_38160 [Streptomyces rubradiris]GHI57557.1 hypothetical protein Srubr_74030 [Streptomyces rubradiris]